MNFSFQKNPRGPSPKAGLRLSDRWKRAFTLLEVMIAVMILFMCLFAVLALLSNSLATARRIQQAHKGVDVATVAGKLYVTIVNTNGMDEGSYDLDLEDVYPGYHAPWDLSFFGSNHLYEVKFDVVHRGQTELHSQFLIYAPNVRSQSGPVSRDLNRH